MNFNNNFPDSWEPTTLDQVAYIEMGQSPDSSYYNAEGVGLPFFQGKAEFGDRYPEVRKWCSESTKIAEAGDVLLSIRAPVGPTNIAKNRSCIGRGLAAIRAEQGINTLYLFYFFRHIESWLSEQGTGSTFTAISGQFVKQLKCAIAPSNEQTRIVEKLEELFSDLDAGVAELKAAQKKLAQYRQSLLKAAVEGELTAEWRIKNKPKETGAQLLERILKERRTRWEEKQLTKFKEQGKTPPKGWQTKYPEPVQPDTTNLPELPEGWVWASVEQICPDDIANGKSVPTTTSGPKVLRLTAVKAGRIDLGEYKCGVWSERDAKPFFVKNGDVLIVRGNGSLSLVGRAGLVSGVTSDIAYPDTMIRVRVLDSIVLPAWLSLVWDSALIRDHLQTRARTSAGIYKIAQPDIISALIPVPPLFEQKAIIVSLEEADHKIQRIENSLNLGFNQAAAQRKNILKSAFSGQLVPQNPNDEPASLLLERIRAERQKQTNNQKPGRGRKKKEAKQ